MKSKKFKVQDLFDIKRGDAENITSKEENNAGIFCVSSRGEYNGIYKKLNLENETVYEKVITINMNGSVGVAFWQEYKFIACCL